jgi:hypothetical protein
MNVAYRARAEAKRDLIGLSGAASANVGSEAACHNRGLAFEPFRS